MGRPTPAQVPYVSYGKGYESRSTFPPDHRGPLLRAEREAAGLDIGQAARQLAIPVQRLVKLEAGTETFADASNWERAANSLRHYAETLRRRRSK